MKVALFIPCYIDQFYPQVAVSTYELLVSLGCTVEYPLNQTCWRTANGELRVSNIF